MRVVLKNLEVNKARFDAQLYKADEALADLSSSQEMATLTTQAKITFNFFQDIGALVRNDSRCAFVCSLIARWQSSSR
jgi:hypothetical protein